MPTLELQFQALFRLWGVNFFHPCDFFTHTPDCFHPDLTIVFKF
jgi:hypothetical protein